MGDVREDLGEVLLAMGRPEHEEAAILRVLAAKFEQFRGLEREDVHEFLELFLPVIGLLDHRAKIIRFRKLCAFRCHQLKA